jgi:hypothetical protein
MAIFLCQIKHSNLSTSLGELLAPGRLDGRPWPAARPRQVGTARVAPSASHTHARCPNSCNRRLWQMSHIATCTTPRSTFETSISNNWNMRLKTYQTIETCLWNTTMNRLEKSIAKHMQHLDKTLATYVWNICNILKKTLATYVWKNHMKHLKQTLCNISV